MNRDPDPDLWDSVPCSVEGQQIHDQRERVRAEVEARDNRVANVIAKAALRGWVVHVVGPGPELLFAAGGWSTAKRLDEAEQFVEKLPNLPRAGA